MSGESSSQLHSPVPLRERGSTARIESPNHAAPTPTSDCNVDAVVTPGPAEAPASTVLPATGPVGPVRPVGTPADDRRRRSDSSSSAESLEQDVADLADLEAAVDADIARIHRLSHSGATEPPPPAPAHSQYAAPVTVYVSPEHDQSRAGPEPAGAAAATPTARAAGAAAGAGTGGGCDGHNVHIRAVDGSTPAPMNVNISASSDALDRGVGPPPLIQSYGNANARNALLALGSAPVGTPSTASPQAPASTAASPPLAGLSAAFSHAPRTSADRDTGTTGPSSTALTSPLSATRPTTGPFTDMRTAATGLPAAGTLAAPLSTAVPPAVLTSSSSTHTAPNITSHAAARSASRDSAATGRVAGGTASDNGLEDDEDELDGLGRSVVEALHHLQERVQSGAVPSSLEMHSHLDPVVEQELVGLYRRISVSSEVATPRALGPGRSHVSRTAGHARSPSAIPAATREEREDASDEAKATADSVVRSGWLHKEGEFYPRAWRRRFFQLRNQTLFYYKTEHDRPKGAIHLEGCAIEKEEDAMAVQGTAVGARTSPASPTAAHKMPKTSRPFAIRVSPPAGLRQRVFRLAAESEKERTVWLTALRETTLTVPSQLLSREQVLRQELDRLVRKYLRKHREAEERRVSVHLGDMRLMDIEERFSAQLRALQDQNRVLQTELSQAEQRALEQRRMIESLLAEHAQREREEPKAVDGIVSTTATAAPEPEPCTSTDPPPNGTAVAHSSTVASSASSPFPLLSETTDVGNDGASSTACTSDQSGVQVRSVANTADSRLGELDLQRQVSDMAVALKGYKQRLKQALAERRSAVTRVQQLESQIAKMQLERMGMGSTSLAMGVRPAPAVRASLSSANSTATGSRVPAVANLGGVTGRIGPRRPPGAPPSNALPV